MHWWFLLCGSLSSISVVVISCSHSSQWFSITSQYEVMPSEECSLVAKFESVSGSQVSSMTYNLLGELLNICFIRNKGCSHTIFSYFQTIVTATQPHKTNSEFQQVHNYAPVFIWYDITTMIWWVLFSYVLLSGIRAKKVKA